MYLPIVLILGLVLCIGLQGCSPTGADALWEDYEKRLVRVLGDGSSSETTLAATPIPRFPQPQKRDLQQGGSIGLLELGRLGHCRLGSLIANHNSSLGKVAEPATRFLYQLEFIQAAPACLDTLQGEEELSSTLSKELERKKAAAIDSFIWFLENDDDIRQGLFVKRMGLAPKSGNAGLSDTQQQLRTLLALRQAIETNDVERIDVTAFKHAIQSLSNNDFLARYMAGMDAHLRALNKLNQRLDGHSMMRCTPGHNHASQEILLNILTKYFIGNIQPYLGVYSESQFELSALMSALFEGSAWQAQVEYYFSDAGIAAEIKAAVREHILIWQRLQQSCRLEIKPGTAGRRPG
ncbi:DUF3080 family protein [Shewanella litorisediminis]|uniref:DUF3080 family protein n=1 Tax=Shewanella litorisediminis TaxID=1173586 RepID=A0ABX7G879_9GAMM|nr:DUF3080 family protein [Shewanella litorisediminis]MCL2919200.1 DUF3080 domain-containing protein [Shewanella litorisediminis]QRH03443.1 DUF3080 family protein [Shewanella litorisediminis]